MGPANTQDSGSRPLSCQRHACKSHRSNPTLCRRANMQSHPTIKVNSIGPLVARIEIEQ
jgi:hypothetical protein